MMPVLCFRIHSTLLLSFLIPILVIVRVRVKPLLHFTDVEAFTPLTNTSIWNLLATVHDPQHRRQSMPWYFPSPLQSRQASIFRSIFRAFRLNLCRPPSLTEATGCGVVHVDARRSSRSLRRSAVIAWRVAERFRLIASGVLLLDVRFGERLLLRLARALGRVGRTELRLTVLYWPKACRRSFFVVFQIS